MTTATLSERELDLWRLIKPEPRQAEGFRASRRYRYLLFGGSRGPGKSWWLRWGLLWRLLDWLGRGQTHIRVGLFSSTYPTLQDRQISKIATEFPRWLGEIKDTRTDGLGFYLGERYGGGILCLRNLDDPKKYYGGEFAGVGVDELTELPMAKFDDLRGSIRWPGIDDTFFWAATMPTGIGLPWVRRLWVERDFPERLRDLADQFHLVQGYPTDNPHLSAAYWEDLRSQPETIQRAWIHGDWYAVVGSVFEEWRPEYHITPAEFVPPRGWSWGAGLDWGYRNPGCFVLFADGPDGDVVAVDELYFRQLHGHDAGLGIGHLCQSWPTPGYIAGDEQMWYRTGVAAPTIAEEVQTGIIRAYGGRIELAPKLVPATHGRGSRLAKLAVMHRYLRWRGTLDRATGRDVVEPWGRPLLRFHPRCRNCIRTIPALPYARDKAGGGQREDVDTNAEDHPYDTVTAYLMSRPQHPERAPRPRPADRHPGFDRRGERRAPEREPKPWEEAYLRRQGEGGSGTGWRVPRQSEEVKE